ncbi:beta-galactosidase [Brachybacterium paraconglomeratum]|uniref:beta-galactosidase n=1 Tax=Brachybacterium paraconglomeratum TaxID=173362 RepID=UPI0022E45062|nr:beta-galactosidase [Brachybacterium paraconglomeratum]
MTSSIELADGRLLLDGVPSVLLCSSAFPFRIPSTQWAHRLDLVRDSGYRMIDVYVHWGFHEPTPGRIDLTSPERDLRRFLDLAAERDLLVMARPGPYICSETDGGGLPWWLHGDAPGAPAGLRTSDPDYLAAVDRWFGAVMPVLAEVQVTRGGPVAFVQIENELDFFDCPDPEEYMSHLAGRTRAHGIEVPIIACAGQGDLSGASGDAEGVVPTVNLYPDDASGSFDEETRRYAGVLADRGLPLMVTETNRLHRTLRREILAGARLVAPYLQTSGFDHLVLPSAGNWGDPGNLMTHDYDFGGYISPDGRRTPEYDEAIALGATLAAWGERLATATPQPLPTDRIDGIRTGGALALDGGGTLLGPAELTGLDVPVRLARAGVDAVVPAGTCPFWALEVPLAPWGAQGMLELATAELVGVERADGVLHLAFEGGPGALIELVLPAADGGSEVVRLAAPGESASQHALDPVRVTLRERAGSLADPAPASRAAAGLMLPLQGALDEAGTDHDPTPGLRGAEALGLADGRVRAELELSAQAQEVLLLGAADLVRLTLDGVDHGVHVAHGAPIGLPLASGAPHLLRVDAEIWGRANFDDARRPALRLGAGRGPGIVLEVRDVSDVTDLWEVRELPDRRADGVLACPPLRGLGGWSSANPGSWTVYARTLTLPGRGLRAVLRLPGLAVPVHVRVQDGPEQLVVPDAPVLLLPEGEGPLEMRVRAPHVPGGLVARAELLITAAPALRSLRTTTEAQLAVRAAELADGAGEDLSPLPAGPLRIGAGTPVLIQLDPLEGDGGGELLEIAGEDVEVTVLSGDRRISRHVLGQPSVAGGDARRSWVPASWPTEAASTLLLLVEAIAPGGGMFRGAKRARTDR